MTWQVTAIYGSGTAQSTLVAAVDPTSKVLVEKAVGWFKTPFSRHVLLANADSGAPPPRPHHITSLRDHETTPT
jgi:hypothetical protein